MNKEENQTEVATSESSSQGTSDKASPLDRLLAIIMIILVILSLTLWVTQGRVKYDNMVYYVSDTEVPTVPNITFSRIDGNCYEAKLFGIFPVGDVFILERDRVTVNLGKEGMLIRGILDGVSIMDFVSETSPAKLQGLQVSDVISAVNGVACHSSEELTQCLDRFGPTVSLTISRQGETFTKDITLDESNRLGIWANSDIFVLGTVSFTKDGYAYGIGHDTAGVTLSGLELIQIDCGSFEDDFISGDSIVMDTSMVLSETYCGVVSTTTSDWKHGDPIEIAWTWELEEGPAQIYMATLNGEYEVIDVTLKPFGGQVSFDAENYSKAYAYTVTSTDTAFISGMSGSPIVQNGRLVGVLAAVNVEKPTIGYCLTAETMYDNLTKELRNVTGDTV